MTRLRTTIGLCGVIGAAVVAAPWLTAAPDLCFTAGPVTYRLSASTNFPDYRIAIDNEASQPQLRIRLVDRVETADFALTDDAGTMSGSGCTSAGVVKTVRVVAPAAPADMTIAISRQPTPGDVSLYVHSARVSHHNAAALFALLHRAPESDVDLDGGPDHVASIR